ncbi:MAG TPA: Rpn family recombination-promoting nuclease/putative transposase, partial [Thermoanaerobaculia bacterium]|nr:Rpn family recombination-promoting nuclease/putative transposase [Thermoanaerobaculia bacterium]
EPVYIYVLMEFQSRPDPAMPVRLMGYVCRFYEDLMAGQAARDWRRLPLVIPMVVYNGSEPWHVPEDLGSMIVDLDASVEIYRPRLRYRLVDKSAYSPEELEALDSPAAELFRIERSRNWSEIRGSIQRLVRMIPPAEDSLRRTFATWLQKVVLPRLGLPGERVITTPTLEEFDTMLAESIDRWNRELQEKSYQEAEARMLLRQLRAKFGTVDAGTEERVRSADAERLLEWGERILTAERVEDLFRD